MTDSRVTLAGVDIDRLPLRGWRLDAVFTLLGAWLIAGVTWDFAVHASGLSFEEEGFLTLPHITFYSAAVAIGLLIAAATVTQGRLVAENRGDRSLREAIPPGYGYGVLGVLLFALGGPLDFVWHQLFGSEQGLEALTSPTHLLLATGAALFLTSPLRAAWIRGVEQSLRRQTPMLVSTAFLVISVAAFAMYANPLFQPVANGQVFGGGGLVGGMSAEHGVLSVAAFSALVMGASLVLLTRFQVARGGFTVVFTVISLPFTGAVGFAFLPVMVVAGVAADVLVAVLDPGPANPGEFRAFAALVPLVLFSAYFAVHHAVWGVAWTTHVWTGAITVAVLVGILMSYAVLPFGGTVEASAATGRSGQE